MPLLLFALAVVARLWQIDLARFADDQATLLASAAQAVVSHRIPLTTGMSFTIGVRHPPLATLLLVPPELVSRNPVVASAYMGLLDALGALFVYWAGRTVAGRWAGLAAGALYALEPAAVVYGRTVWNPDLVPLCSAIALWGLVEFWQRDNDWALAAALFAGGCAAQLHPQAATLLVVWPVVAIAKGRWRWPSAVALGVLGLVLAPYLYLQLTSGWSDAQAAIRYLQQPKQLDGQAFTTVAALFSGHTYSDLLLPHGQSQPVFPMDPLGWFFAAALLGGLASAFVVRRKGELVVAACFVAPLLATVSHSGDVAPHYLLVLLPSGCLLAALALAAVEPRWLGSALLGAGLAIAGVEWVQLQQGVPEAVNANYDMPLRYSAEAAQLLPGGPAFVADREEQAGVFGYLLPGRPGLKRFDGRYTFVWPSGPASYLADANLPFASEELAGIGAPSRQVQTPAGRTAYALFSVPGGAKPSGSFQPLDVDVAHAVRLTGLAAPDLRAGGPSLVTLRWQITDPHAAIPSDVRQFGHLVDASGKVWSTNLDFRGYPRPFWEAGEVVDSGFQLDLPAGMPSGGYWFDTGFYEPISGQRLPQFQNGNLAGTSARTGPLKVRGQSPAASGPPLATFGDGQIALLGAQRIPSGVSLRWQALKKSSQDYTVFVHVLNAQGAVVAQNDSPPRDGSYPTSMWDPGEVVDDPHPLSFTPEPGQQLEVGLYSTPDLRRLPVDGQNADRVLLPVPT
ncbi:MAG TPA: glycosyltransferase family 39 protein [Chloroflexota bacterium]|nr:glycosyltransferase family 39 protein [Chloroflexota bacterium]